MRKLAAGQPMAAAAVVVAAVTVAVATPPRSRPTSTAQVTPSSMTTARANSGSRIESVAVARSLAFGVISTLAAPARSLPGGAWRDSGTATDRINNATAAAKKRVIGHFL